MCVLLTLNVCLFWDTVHVIFHGIQKFALFSSGEVVKAVKLCFLRDLNNRHCY